MGFCAAQFPGRANAKDAKPAFNINIQTDTPVASSPPLPLPVHLISDYSREGGREWHIMRSVCVNKKGAEHGPVLPSMAAESSDSFSPLSSTSPARVTSAPFCVGGTYSTEMCMSITDGRCILNSQPGYFIASCRLRVESSAKVRALVSRTLSQSSYVCNINLVTT